MQVKSKLKAKGQKKNKQKSPKWKITKLNNTLFPQNLPYNYMFCIVSSPLKKKQRVQFKTCRFSHFGGAPVETPPGEAE